jgi:fumarate hydratase class II
LGIGGTAVGTGLNAHPEFHPRMVQRLREITGLDLSTSSDLFESMQSMADAADFSAAMRILALTLTRIANDLRLMASGPASGLDEIRFAPLQPGSSIMPGKVNPVMAEMLNQAMYQIMGLDLAVALASQAGQFELNVMMPVIAHDLFEMMQLMIGAIGAFTVRGVKSLQANPERAAQWLERNAIIATALSPLIGYAAAAELVKTAQAAGRGLRETALERAKRGELAQRHEARVVAPAEVEAALNDVRRMTEGGLQSDAHAPHA